MSYQPLAEVRKDFQVNWYRCPIAPNKLRELATRSNLKGGSQAGGHLALFLLTGTLAYWFWSQNNWLAFVLALFCHGTVASFFAGTAPHELGHGTVFRTRWLNKAFKYLFSLISWWNPFDYASSHTYHHRYTLHPQADRENLLPLHPATNVGFLLQLLTINVFTQPGRTFGKGGLISAVIVTVKAAFGVTGSPTVPSNEWLRALHEDQPLEHRKSIWWSRLLLLFHGSVFVVALASDAWVLVLIISTASFIANWLSYAVGLTQHCGLRDNVTDFRKCTRSIKLNPVAEFLYWHMNWHTEHHMYAAVPCYNLKKLAREIAADMPEPRSLWEAWQEMLATWGKQQADPNYQFDTPLPPGANTASSRTSERLELEYSIGDLAPKSLQ